MYKYKNIAIVISFFSLWLDSYLPEKHQLLLGFFFIFTFGILHGANDLVLIKSLNNTQKKISYQWILSYYIIIVVLGVSLFYKFPLFALILFIIVSGLHFGEQHWQSLKYLNRKFQICFQLIYGVFILFLLFNFHPLEVQNIVLEITQVTIPKEYILFLLIFFGGLLSVFFLYLSLYVENLYKQIILEVFYLLVFALIFSSSGLIWGFAIFFIFWHSIPSMIDQIQFLYRDVTFGNFKLYFKSAFLYWIASLFGLTFLYFIFKDEKIFNALFFSFLAAITFPHTLVILKMFGRKS
jgi:Brp/Blh family beta-carotene 15,15'-monooxygenase